VSEPAAPSPAAADTAARVPAIRVVLLPKDTNALGTIFGGVILSYIDQAGAVEAHRTVPGRIVTVSMREVVFHAPVFVGDLVSFFTRTLRVGNTSVTVDVLVEAERGVPGGPKVKVTEAEVVFVHVGQDGRPLPIPGKS
jgi:acyl-CoA thioesterase YciA